MKNVLQFIVLVKHIILYIKLAKIQSVLLNKIVLNSYVILNCS